VKAAVPPSQRGLAANSVSVAEQALHGGQIHAGFDQMSREGVS